jgi:hypothetical protein
MEYNMSEFSFLVAVVATVVGACSYAPLEKLVDAPETSIASQRSLTAHWVCAAASPGITHAYVGTMSTDTIEMKWRGSQLKSCKYRHGIH